jgi:transposase-like protein
LPGRLNLEKTLVVVAVHEDGDGIGRIRMRQIPDASAESLMPFIQGSVASGSIVHTDGWLGYLPVKNSGYEHEVTYLKGNKKTPSELLPRVHLVISHLKRWLLGTHQGAVSHKHLDYYLDEFTYRLPATLKTPRQTLLSTRAASCGGRSSALESDSSS